MQQDWSKIKKMYSFTCEEVLGKAWMIDDTCKLVEVRRTLKAIKTRTQKLAAVNMYKKKNLEVKRNYRRNKRRRIEKLARESEEAGKQRGMKKVYDSRRKRVQSKPVKDEDAVILTRTDDQLNCWKKHFQKVLNRPTPENPPDLTKEPPLAMTLHHGRSQEILEIPEEWESPWVWQHPPGSHDGRRIGFYMGPALPSE